MPFDTIKSPVVLEKRLKMRYRITIFCLLRRLYAEQKGTVSTDTESDMFEKKKITKQGDPLSSLLFNTVLQMALKDDVKRWQKSECMGIRLGDHESYCLTNLRFADDVFLFSTSCSSEK